MAKFFYIPFAQNGNISTTPDPTQVGGLVSYNQGWPINYQLPLAGGGSAQPINRAQMNGVLNDITGALLNIQSQGVFSWIGASPNTPPDYSGNYPYPINALVYYTDGNIYQSLIANNQDVPGATINWRNVSLNPGGVPIGTVIDFAGRIPPTDFFACDIPNTTGNGISRTTYAALMAAITLSLAGTTTGTSPVVTMASTSGVGVGDNVESANIPAGTTVLSIVNNVSITLSQNASSSGATTLQFFPWGNGDGSTTFYLPYLSRRTTIGSNGTGTNVIGNMSGNYGGIEAQGVVSDNLPPHVHNPLSGGSFAMELGGSGLALNTGGSSYAASTTGTNTTANTPLNIMQPSAVMLKCIKYQ